MKKNDTWIDFIENQIDSKKKDNDVKAYIEKNLPGYNAYTEIVKRGCMRLSEKTRQDFIDGNLKHLSSRAVHVYIVLACSADNFLDYFPISLNEISEMTGLVKNTIQAGLKEIINAGLVERQKHSNREVLYRVLR